MKDEETKKAEEEAKKAEEEAKKAEEEAKKAEEEAKKAEEEAKKAEEAKTEPATIEAAMEMTPRENPNSGLTEVEELDSFGRVIHRTVSRSAAIDVVTTFTDDSEPKAKVLTLDGLLEYTEKDVSEKIFEVSLLAETFRDMILLRFARVIQTAFAEAIETSKEMQSLAVADATESAPKEEEAAKEPMEEGEIPKPVKKEEPKPVPVSVKVNRDMYVACQYFDKKNKGFLTQSELMNVLLNANLVCCKGEAETILNQVCQASRFNYRDQFKSLSCLLVCLE